MCIRDRKYFLRRSGRTPMYRHGLSPDGAGKCSVALFTRPACISSITYSHYSVKSRLPSGLQCLQAAHMNPAPTHFPWFLSSSLEDELPRCYRIASAKVRHIISKFAPTLARHHIERHSVEE